MSVIPGVSPSIDWAIALRSSGFVTCRISCVLHWERTVLSIRAARWVTAQRPRPNFRPSLAMFFRMREQVGAALLRGEVVRLLDHEEQRGDLVLLPVLEEGRSDPGHHELLNVGSDPAEVDQRRFAELHAAR